MMGRRITGLELAPGKLIAVEVSPSAVVRAAVTELPEGELAKTPLKPLLGRLGVRTKSLHLVAGGSEQIHRTLLIPPMIPSERSLFLERELGRESAGAIAFGSQVLRQVGDGTRKDEVLVVAAPRKGLDGLLAPFLAARLIPHLVATAPLALVRAAQVLSPIPVDRPTIISHWGLSGLTIAVVSDGVLTLARQIPRVAAPGFHPVEWLATEIERSIRHDRLITDGGQVQQVLFGNADPTMEGPLADPGELATRLGLPVLSVNQLLRPLLPDSVEEAGFPAGAFLLPFGAALLTPREAPNLLPRELAVARRSREVTRAAFAAAVLLGLALGGSFWVAGREAAALRQRLERQRTVRQAYQVGLSEIERIGEQRQRVRRWIRLVSGDPLGGPPLADALKEVSRFAPDGLRLERLVISKDGLGYAMKLTGGMREGDLARAQSELNQFYFGLRESPFFYDVTFSKGGGPLAFELSLRLKGIL